MTSCEPSRGACREWQVVPWAIVDRCSFLHHANENLWRGTPTWRLVLPISPPARYWRGGTKFLGLRMGPAHRNRFHRSAEHLSIGWKELVASLLLVVWPGAPSSFLLLVVRHLLLEARHLFLVASLLLVVWPGAPSFPRCFPT